MKEIEISQVDVLFTNGIYPIEFLFYYKERPDTAKIRNSLQKLASVFWPMFGKYKDGRITFDTYFEEDFYEEEVIDREFAIPGSEEERWEVYSRYRLPASKKLFRLKMMQFRNGMAMIPRMSHLAGDGYSYFFFLSALAALSQHTFFPAKSSLMPYFFKPHHRRTILRDFSFEEAKRELPWQDTRFTMGIVKVLRKAVDSSIREVAESKNFRISSNDILSATALKMLAGIQKKVEGEFAELTIPIDVRRQIKQYGRRFFGNGIWLYKMKFKKGDIDNLPPEELAVQIRKSMPSVSKRSYTEYLSHLEEIITEEEPEKLMPYDPESGFLVTNISRLPVDRMNFGTGTPDFIFPLTIEKNAAAVLAEDENFILRFAH